MKAFTKLLFVAFVAMLGLASCDKQEELAPTIEIKEVVVADDSYVFSIKTKGASKCAYILYDGDQMTAERVFSEGVAVKNFNDPVAVGNLKSGTTYHIVAAAKNSVDAVLSNTLTFTTNGSSDNGNDNGGNSGGNNGGNNGGGNDDNFELPEIDGVENVVITKTNGGCWWKEYNYYVYFVLDNGDRIQLDFYTLSDTMSLYFPYGTYTLGSTYAPYTIHPETSCYLPNGWEGFGYTFTDAYVTVDVVGGYYAIYMRLTYDADGVEKSIQGYWNGIMSNASVPAGDDAGSDKLIEVLEVGSTSFKFRINAEPDQYWRCSVVDKRVFNQSNPGAWVVTYGFMLGGTLTFDWVNGEYCEYVPSLEMKVTSSTDYLIIAALMDYSEGKENSLLGGVEIVEIRTKASELGTSMADINMKEVNVNDVVFDCVMSEDLWCCYVAMLETEYHLGDIKAGSWKQFYSSYEECMLSLVSGLSYSSMRQFLTTTYDYKFDGLKYGTSYTMCVKTEDMQGRVTYQEYGPFVTKRP